MNFSSGFGIMNLKSITGCYMCFNGNNPAKLTHPYWNVFKMLTLQLKRDKTSKDLLVDCFPFRKHFVCSFSSLPTTLVFHNLPMVGGWKRVESRSFMQSTSMGTYNSDVKSEIGFSCFSSRRHYTTSPSCRKAWHRVVWEVYYISSYPVQLSTHTP